MINESSRPPSASAANARRHPRKPIPPATHLRTGLIAAVLLMLSAGCVGLVRHPPGTPFSGPPRPAADVEFLRDLTYTDAEGCRHSDQQIFDAVLETVRESRSLLVADLFLFNEWTGTAGPPYRAVCRELTEALIEWKQQRPSACTVLITDPINTVYGAVDPLHLRRLRAAGVPVVLTNLDVLRDSNPTYSFWWRLFISPFGVGPGRLMPNPFDSGRVSVRAWLRLLNFKANHRKVVIGDPEGLPTAIVTSWNPHDGSSAHGNVALRFDGPAVFDLLATERRVIEFSHASASCELRSISPSREQALPSALTVRVLTESAIRDAAANLLDSAGPGDEIDLIMFYFSHRDLIRRLIRAYQRGVHVRVVLDPNKDAFGRQKNGIPNRQTAWRLHRAGLPLRWYDTHGEQCHSKMLLLRTRNGRAALLAGSANFTRRNLDDFNLETDVLVEGPAGKTVFQDARTYFEDVWENRGGRHCTVPYVRYADRSLLRRLLASFMEWSGFSTF